MSQDEIRKLLGGYATGTLTDAERKALFTAALDDQELFDELGREQSLKDLLDVPGARTRLAAALAPPAARSWWRSPLPWALAGTVAAAVLVLVVVTRTPHPTEIAGLKVSPQPAMRASVDQPAAGEPALDQTAKTIRSEPSPAPVPVRKQEAKPLETTRRDALNTGAASAPSPPALQPAVPAQSLKKDEAGKTDSLGPVLADKSTADEKDARPPVQVMTQSAQVQVQNVPSGIGGREQQLVAGNSPAPGAPAPSALASTGSLRPRLAFDYSLRRDNLSVRALATGFLQVTALSSTGQPALVQPASRLESGKSLNIAIPAGSITLTVDFTGTAPPRSTINRIANADAFTVQRAAKAASKAPVPAPRERTGTVEEALPLTTDPRASVILAVPSE